MKCVVSSLAWRYFECAINKAKGLRAIKGPKQEQSDDGQDDAVVGENRPGGHTATTRLVG
jgi:hypothetical protein